jgi:hypothetical protein
MITRYYTSADKPGPNSAWSVYSEDYARVDSPEPIEDSQKWIGSFMSEETADFVANRMGR